MLLLLLLLLFVICKLLRLHLMYSLPRRDRIVNECSMTKSHVRYVWLAGWVGAHDDGVIITDSSQQANRQIKLHTQNNCKAQRLPLWRELWLLVCLVHGLKMVRHMLCYLMYLQLKKLYSERRLSIDFSLLLLTTKTFSQQSTTYHLQQVIQSPIAMCDSP